MPTGCFSIVLTVCQLVVSALYLLYAKLEEEHGLARHAMAVYDRATSAVLPEQQYEVMQDILLMSDPLTSVKDK